MSRSTESYRRKPDAANGNPLVSIGLTVFNSEKYLARTLDSLLGQDYEYFEIIISDNASEDSTPKICLEYAEKDRRIKYYRSIKNMGAIANATQAFTLSSGEYFLMAADHDLYDASYIGKMLRVLCSDPSVVLCYGKTIIIDEQDNPVQMAPDEFDTRGLSLAEGFRKIIWEVSWGNMFRGLFRSEIFLLAMPIPNTIGGDLVLLGRVALLGAIAQINEPLFFRRETRPEENASEQTARQKRFMGLSSRSMEAETPWLMMSHAHLESLAKSDIPDHQKNYLAGEVIKACVSRFGNLMIREIRNKATNAFIEFRRNRQKSVLDDIHCIDLVRFSGIAVKFFPFLEGINLIAGIGYLRMGLSEIAKAFAERELREYPDSRNGRALVNYINSGGSIQDRGVDPMKVAGKAEEVERLLSAGNNDLAASKIEEILDIFPENKDQKILQFVERLRKAPPSRKLRLMQMDTFYSKALEIIYRKNPALSLQSYAMQMEAIRKEGFAAVHTLAPYLSATGYDTFWAIANNPFTQMKWMKEQGIPSVNEREWIYDVAARQIEAFKPDILYTTDACLFDSRFIRRLTGRPPVVAGWHAADIPAHTDWSEFDLILSALEGVRAEAERIGAKAGVCFTPGFPEWIQQEIIDVHATKDVVFCGQWTVNQHSRRNYLIECISREASEKGRFSLSLFLSGRTDLFPEVVRKNQAGERYGMEMYRALRTGRIGLDGRGSIRKEGSVPGSKELAGNQTANMRIFETTGSGVFLLAEHFENLSDFFEIGREIETFRTEEELVEKIEYYIRHPEEREEIALRGQRRCLTDHSMTSRIRLFDSIVRNALAGRKASSGMQESVSNNWLGEGRCEGGVVIPAR